MVISAQIDPPNPPDTPQEIILRKENAALHATIAAMEADNARDVAAHGRPPPRYAPLKQIDPSPYSYEAVRIWAKKGGLIDAEKRSGRWFAVPASVFKRIRELMSPKS
jgi:hypothetical protein